MTVGTTPVRQMWVGLPPYLFMLYLVNKLAICHASMEEQKNSLKMSTTYK